MAVNHAMLSFSLAWTKSPARDLVESVRVSVGDPGSRGLELRVVVGKLVSFMSF